MKNRRVQFPQRDEVMVVGLNPPRRRRLWRVIILIGCLLVAVVVGVLTIGFHKRERIAMVEWASGARISLERPSEIRLPREFWGYVWRYLPSGISNPQHRVDSTLDQFRYATSRPVNASFSGPKSVSAEQVRLLATFPTLKQVRFSNCTIAGGALPALAGLPELETVRLSRRGIADTGLYDDAVELLRLRPDVDVTGLGGWAIARLSPATARAIKKTRHGGVAVPGTVQFQVQEWLRPPPGADALVPEALHDVCTHSVRRFFGHTKFRSVPAPDARWLVAASVIDRRIVAERWWPLGENECEAESACYRRIMQLPERSDPAYLPELVRLAEESPTAPFTLMFMLHEAFYPSHDPTRLKVVVTLARMIDSDDVTAPTKYRVLCWLGSLGVGRGGLALMGMGEQTRGLPIPCIFIGGGWRYYGLGFSSPATRVAAHQVVDSALQKLLIEFSLLEFDESTDQGRRQAHWMEGTVRLLSYCREGYEQALRLAKSRPPASPPAFRALSVDPPLPAALARIRKQWADPSLSGLTPQQLEQRRNWISRLEAVVSPKE